MTPSEVLADTKANGGGTYLLDPREGWRKIVREDGYWVAGGMIAIKLHKYIDPPEWKQAIHLANGAWLGTWIEGDYIWVEPTVWAPNLEAAMKWAEEGGQRFIYDCAAKKSIPVKPTLITMKKLDYKTGKAVPLEER